MSRPARLPVWLTPHQRDGGRFQANAYPDPAPLAIEHESTLPDSLTCMWQEMGWMYDPEMLCWRWACEEDGR